MNQYFLKLISPWTQSASRGSHVLILTELARGKNRLKDVAAAVNRSQRETSQQIHELMERELILKTGVFFRFHNKAFKFWLREVYQKKELSLLDAGEKAESFLQRIHEIIAEHEELSRMDVSERVVQLFRQFKNDIIEFGEKRRKLPHFTELLQSGSPRTARDEGSRRIIAKGHGRCWLCKIVEEKVTERDVLELVAGSSSKSESRTKVLLALRGLDENAKLLAKEKRVFTLGLSRLNMLMDVYGYSPIIHSPRPVDSVPTEEAVTGPVPA